MTKINRRAMAEVKRVLKEADEDLAEMEAEEDALWDDVGKFYEKYPQLLEDLPDAIATLTSPAPYPPTLPISEGFANEQMVDTFLHSRKGEWVLAPVCSFEHSASSRNITWRRVHTETNDGAHEHWISQPQGRVVCDSND